jgi:hypothetical protein
VKHPRSGPRATFLRVEGAQLQRELPQHQDSLVRGRSSRATPDNTTQSPSSQLPPGNQCRAVLLAVAATANEALCLCLSSGASLRWCSQDGSKHAVKCPSNGLRPTRLGVGCPAPALLAVGDILGCPPGVASAPLAASDAHVRMGVGWQRTRLWFQQHYMPARHHSSQ